MLENANQIEEYMQEWARLHYKLHSIDVNDFPSIHEVFEYRIQNCEHILDEMDIKSLTGVTLRWVLDGLMLPVSY